MFFKFTLIKAIKNNQILIYLTSQLKSVVVVIISSSSINNNRYHKTKKKHTHTNTHTHVSLASPFSSFLRLQKKKQQATMTTVTSATISSVRLSAFSPCFNQQISRVAYFLYFEFFIKLHANYVKLSTNMNLHFSCNAIAFISFRVDYKLLGAL